MSSVLTIDSLFGILESLSTTDLDPEVRERIRERSKALYGNRDRLEVAAAIAREDLSAVNATDLSLKLGMAPNRVRAQILALAEANLLVPVSPQDRKRWFQRRGDPEVWQAFVKLLEAWRRS